MSSPSQSPTEETREKLNNLNENMNEYEFVYESTIEVNEVHIIVDDDNVNDVKEIMKPYTELAILKIPYVADNKYNIIVGYAGRL